MKKKVLIIISIVAVLALGGTIAVAATDNGELVNPFTRILGEKVEDGTITEDEANVFSKVWNAIRDEDKGSFRRPGMKPGGFSERGFFPEDEELMDEVHDAMEEIHDELEAKIDEIIDGLATDNLIDEELAEELKDDPKGIIFLLRDADEETLAAFEAAFFELHEYGDQLVDEMVASGELSEEAAELISDMGNMMNDSGFFERGRMPRMRPSGGFYDSDDPEL